MAEKPKWTALTQAEVAGFFGLKSADTVKDWHRDGMPGKVGRDGVYDLRACFLWARENGKFQKAGKDSMWLEKYREERAKLAGLERRTKERQVIEVDCLTSAMAQVAKVLRGSGDQLQRRFGGEAAEILNEAVDAMLQIIEQGLPK